jgi:hypothetical protein
MSDDLQAKWERIDGHLRAAMATVDLPSRDRAQVEEFLNHNELGVAFEWIVSVLRRSHATQTDALGHLSAAAREMDLEDNSDWRALQTLG